MEEINTDAGKANIWVRTQMNAPAQRPWFTDTGGATGTGQMATGRVAANQMKSAAYRWRWKEYKRLSRAAIAGIAAKADVSPIEFADRQTILLTNPGLNGRLQVTNTIRCAISIYNPGDIAPAHVHSPERQPHHPVRQGRLHQCRGRALRGDARRHHPDPERHLARPRQRGQGAGDLDRHARLAADGVPRLRLGRPGLQAGVRQQRQEPGDRSTRTAIRSRLYGNGGMVPTFVSHQLGFGRDPAPLIHFRGDQIREALEALRKEKGDPHEGIQMQFVNPVTGKPVFSDAQLPGAAPAPRRGDAAQARDLRHLHRGDRRQGQVGDRRPDLRLGAERHHGGAELPLAPHINTGTSDAISTRCRTRAAALKNIGQYRAQGKDKDGKVMQLVQ